jgi:hypothetical protein
MSKAKNATKSAPISEENLKIVGQTEVSPDKLHYRDSNLLGRSRPVSDEEVVILADSMREDGQQQPIQVRPMHTEGEYEIIFGNTRKRAADLIQKGYKTLTPSGKDYKDIPANPGFKLRCEIVEVDDATAFKRNVVENVRRNATSPIDNAMNQQILREHYKMSDSAIARLYGYAHPSSVFRLKKLLLLPDFMQDYTHDARLSQMGAFILAEFAEKEGPNALDVVWKSITAPGHNEDDINRLDTTRIGAVEVSDAIKKYKADKKAGTLPPSTDVPAVEGTTTPPAESTTTPAGEAAQPTANGTPTTERDKSMTLKQVKGVLEDMKAGANVPAIMRTFATYFLDYITGGSAEEFGRWVQSYATDEERAEWKQRAEQQAATQQTAEQPAQPEEAVTA